MSAIDDECMRIMTQSPNERRFVMATLGNKASVSQIVAGIKNFELFRRFVTNCPRWYISFMKADVKRKPDDYLIFIHELELYGLRSSSEISLLNSALNTPIAICNLQPYYNKAFHLSLGGASTPEEQAFIDEEQRKEDEYDARMGCGIFPAPKFTMYQVILASESCKLVFYCSKPDYVETIKAKIRDRWSRVATSVANATGEIEITVDSKHANLEESGKFYVEILQSLMPDKDVIGSMRQMLLFTGDDEKPAWAAAIDSKIGDIIAQMKTFTDKSPMIINTTMNHCTTGNIAIGNAASAGASTSAAAVDPFPIATEWIIANPPGANERRTEYRARYLANHTTSHVSDQVFSRLVRDRGYSDIHRKNGWFWIKK